MALGERAADMTLTHIEKGKGVSETYIRVDTGYLDAYNDSIQLDYRLESGLLTDSGLTIFNLETMGISGEQIQKLHLPPFVQLEDEDLVCRTNEAYLPIRAAQMAQQIVHIYRTFNKVNEKAAIIRQYQAFKEAEAHFQEQSGVKVVEAGDRALLIDGEEHEESSLAYWSDLSGKWNREKNGI